MAGDVRKGLEVLGDRSDVAISGPPDSGAEVTRARSSVHLSRQRGSMDSGNSYRFFEVERIARVRFLIGFPALQLLHFDLRQQRFHGREVDPAWRERGAICGAARRRKPNRGFATYSVHRSMGETR